MATATRRRTIGPADHGKKIGFKKYIEADCVPGWFHELGRGVIVVTEIPRLLHGRVVDRLAELFILYRVAHPNVINYRAGGGECRLLFPGMKSERHPDQAVYLDPPPPGEDPWSAWCPHLVVEVVSRGGRKRDYEEKREEYLRAGVREYWILDPAKRTMLVLTRAGDTWAEKAVGPRATYRSQTLPGLEVVPNDLFGPAEAR
jgi:Uma2 family endonuclease